MSAPQSGQRFSCSHRPMVWARASSLMLGMLSRSILFRRDGVLDEHAFDELGGDHFVAPRILCAYDTQRPFVSRRTPRGLAERLLHFRHRHALADVARRTGRTGRPERNDLARLRTILTR